MASTTPCTERSSHSRPGLREWSSISAKMRSDVSFSEVIRRSVRVRKYPAQERKPSYLSVKHIQEESSMHSARRLTEEERSKQMVTARSSRKLRGSLTESLSAFRWRPVSCLLMQCSRSAADSES